MEHPVDPNSYDANDPFGSTAGRRYPHTGSDYAVAFADVRSVADAVVYHTGFNEGNGNYICTYLPGFDWKGGIQGGAYISYLHLSSINVSEGQTVKQGERIGVSGNSGTNSNGPHLHITLSNSDRSFLGEGIKVDPWQFIQNNLGAPAKPVAPKPPVTPKPGLTPAQQKRLDNLTARKKRVEAELKLEQDKLPALVKTRDDLAKLVVNLTDVFNKAKAALEKATADVVRVQANRVTAENGVTAVQARVASLQKDVAKLANDISKIKK